MKAIQMSHFESPGPGPGPGQVLVRVRAAGADPDDTLMRKNRYAMTPPLPSDRRLWRWRERTDNRPTMRCWYKVSPLFISPDRPHERRNGAHQCRMGGCSILVQLAKRAGAKFIIAGASTAEKLAFARSLGADYTRSGWVETLRAVAWRTSDGGEPCRTCAPRPTRRLWGAQHSELSDRCIGTFGTHLQEPIVDRLRACPAVDPREPESRPRTLFDLAARGELKVTVGGSYPLERVADAHRALEGRRSTSKLVLVPSGPMRCGGTLIAPFKSDGLSLLRGGSQLRGKASKRELAGLCGGDE